MTGRKITLAKGGTAERTVTIHEITIPDMWHVANRIGKGIVHRDDRAMILEVWNLAHDLRRHIQEGDWANGSCCSHCRTYFMAHHGYPVLCRQCFDEGTKPEQYGLPRATILELCE